MVYSSDKQVKRVLVKLSGEMLSGEEGTFDYDKIDGIAQQLKSLIEKGIEVAVVCGAGNIRRWRDTIDAGIERVKSDHLGMMATVMNAVLLNERVVQNGGDGVVFSPTGIHIPPITKEYNVLTARSRLRSGKVVFCAGGTGNPYATTDSGAVLRALELNCELVIKATKVDGIYTADPMKDPAATKYDTISYHEVLQNSISVMDQSAFGMAKEENMPIYVCHVDTLHTIADGLHDGTIVTN